MYDYRVLKVERVIDGDTVDVVLDLGFNVSLKQRFRILGINTPELKDKDPFERARAIEAKKFAEDWFGSEGELRVESYKDDKYGRMLGDFYFGQRESYTSFSEAILKANLAGKYQP